MVGGDISGARITTMSKAIQTMETAVAGAGAQRGAAGRPAGPNESGAFSRLLSAGQVEHARPTEAQTVPPGGKNLPGEPQQEPARDDTGALAAAPADGQDRTRTAEQENSAALPDVVAESIVMELPVEGGDTGAAEVAVMDGTTEPAVTLAATDGQETVAEEPAAPVGDTIGAEILHTALPVTTPGLAAAQAAEGAAAAAAGPVNQVAADVLQAGGEDPAGTRLRPGQDAIGQAVREGVMQMLASRTAHGQGGDAPATGRDGQPPVIDSSTGARAAAAGILSFSDTLLETGSSLPAARVATPVGQPGWGRAVGEQVVWFVSQNIQSASLKLNPQHLGPLELQLHMDGDKASIAFTSHHAGVRDALEASLPRLRDLFTAQGLNLVNVNVSQQDAGSGHGQTTAGNRQGPGYSAPGVDEQLPATAVLAGPATARGLVDYYA
jgi:flagellar hook-length control protein FliK